MFIATNAKGESLPVLQALTTEAIQIDGTNAHAESSKLDRGLYRIAVRSSVNGLGVMLKITDDDADTATTTTGTFMPDGCVEVYPVEEGQHITVIDGKLNVTKLI